MNGFLGQDDGSYEEGDDVPTPDITVTPSDIPSFTISATPTSTDDASLPAPTDTDNSTIIDQPVPAANRTVNPAVCSALSKWYQSLNGNGWIVKTGWDSTDMTTCCSWYNVHCSAVGQVIKV